MAPDRRGKGLVLRRHRHPKGSSASGFTPERPGPSPGISPEITRCRRTHLHVVYVDPGNETSTEMRHWGRAHEHLWASMRERNIKIHVAAIGVTPTPTNAREPY